MVERRDLRRPRSGCGIDCVDATVASSFPELARERVMQALAGDRAAIAEVYRTYRSTVLLAVVAAIRHRPSLGPELDDFVSEVWIRFVADGCRRLRSYDPERGAFGYYLRMRAFATARMLAERRGHRGIDRAESCGARIDDELEARVVGRDALARLWAALADRLGRADLQLFSAVFIEGRFVREVAEMLGLGEAVVFRRSQRLRRKVERIAAELAANAGRGPQPTARQRSLGARRYTIGP
jgi:RNA polymerase sigma factor (sigma-70 family)